jgi:hypothetical protein
MEVHGGGWKPSRPLRDGVRQYYERGLLHPMLDYESQTLATREIIDPLDADGYVHVADRPASVRRRPGLHRDHAVE